MNLIGKQIKATYKKNGFVIEGTVSDVSVNQQYIWVENEIDSYCLDSKKVNIDVIKPEPAEPVVKVAEDYAHTDLKEVRKQIEKLVKWSDEAEIKVSVYNWFEDDVEGYDVEAIVKYDDKNEYITINTYGKEKDAIKRAKIVLKTIKGWRLYNVNDSINILNNIDVYTC